MQCLIAFESGLQNHTNDRTGRAPGEFNQRLLTGVLQQLYYNKYSSVDTQATGWCCTSLQWGVMPSVPQNGPAHWQSAISPHEMLT